MTLRRRLSLWYGVVLVVCVLLAVLPAYDELVLDAPNYSQYEVQIAHKRFRDVLKDMVLVSLPPVLIGIVGGWFMVRRALRPLERMIRLAEKMDEHTLGERLPPERRDEEIERLARVFNAMAARLGGAFQRVRDFTLNASHELKTPLAILRGEMETNLRTWKGLSEEQRNQIGAQIDEIDRLAKIVDGLTFLVKADADQLTLAYEPVMLHELVSDMVEDAETLAQARQINVSLESCAEVTVKGDRQRLRQVLLNLTDNAIKYNERGGWVKIALERKNSEAQVVVKNSGPGLAMEHQGRVFERFFRGPEQGGQPVEGSGLGLSIANWIMQKHGGRLDFQSEPGLTTVTLRMRAV